MSAPDNQRVVTDRPQDWARNKPPIKLAQGKMGTLLAAIAGLIVLTFSISQEKSIIELCPSLITSIVIFWFLGWCCALAINWHFRSSSKRQAESEQEAPAGEENVEESESAPSEDNLVDENQSSPA